MAQTYFQGIDTNSNGATDSRDDSARLKCWSCEIQYGLKWNHTTRTFELTTTGYTGGGAWNDCTTDGSQEVCEYSSGVCFVEERRTFGYVTLVRKGCKQAQACYRNKHQNFLVQAGRQCWPGDARTPGSQKVYVPRRPHDINSDEWIYNLVKGGSLADNTGFGLVSGSNTAATAAQARMSTTS